MIGRRLHHVAPVAPLRGAIEDDVLVLRLRARKRLGRERRPGELLARRPLRPSPRRPQQSPPSSPQTAGGAGAGALITGAAPAAHPTRSTSSPGARNRIPGSLRATPGRRFRTRTRGPAHASMRQSSASTTRSEVLYSTVRREPIASPPIWRRHGSRERHAHLGGKPVRSCRAADAGPSTASGCPGSRRSPCDRRRGRS